MMPRERLTPKESQVATLVWQGLTNREIGRLMRTTEQVIKNHLRSTFDKLRVSPVWSWRRMSPATAARTGKILNGPSSSWFVPQRAWVDKRRSSCKFLHAASIRASAAKGLHSDPPIPLEHPGKALEKQ
jgi:hypothetical protein